MQGSGSAHVGLAGARQDWQLMYCEQAVLRSLQRLQKTCVAAALQMTAPSQRLRWLTACLGNSGNSLSKTPKHLRSLQATNLPTGAERHLEQQLPQQRHNAAPLHAPPHGQQQLLAGGQVTPHGVIAISVCSGFAAEKSELQCWKHGATSTHARNSVQQALQPMASSNCRNRSSSQDCLSADMCNNRYHGSTCPQHEGAASASKQICVAAVTAYADCGRKSLEALLTTTVQSNSSSSRPAAADPWATANLQHQQQAEADGDNMPQASPCTMSHLGFDGSCSDEDTAIGSISNSDTSRNQHQQGNLAEADSRASKLVHLPQLPQPCAQQCASALHGLQGSPSAQIITAAAPDAVWISAKLGNHCGQVGRGAADQSNLHKVATSAGDARGMPLYTSQTASNSSGADLTSSALLDLSCRDLLLLLSNAAAPASDARPSSGHLPHAAAVSTLFSSAVVKGRSYPGCWAASAQRQSLEKPSGWAAEAEANPDNQAGAADAEAVAEQQSALFFQESRAFEDSVKLCASSGKAGAYTGLQEQGLGQDKGQPGTCWTGAERGAEQEAADRCELAGNTGPEVLAGRGGTDCWPGGQSQYISTAGEVAQHSSAARQAHGATDGLTNPSGSASEPPWGAAAGGLYARMSMMSHCSSMTASFSRQGSVRHMISALTRSESGLYFTGI